MIVSCSPITVIQICMDCSKMRSGQYCGFYELTQSHTRHPAALNIH